jgi:hypothetical protein
MSSEVGRKLGQLQWFFRWRSVRCVADSKRASPWDSKDCVTKCCLCSEWGTSRFMSRPVKLQPCARLEAAGLCALDGPDL